MPGTGRRHKTRRKNSVRWIVLAIVLCSGASCLAPVLYASTDCSRWLAEYKQGILQRPCHQTSTGGQVQAYDPGREAGPGTPAPPSPIA